MAHLITGNKFEPNKDIPDLGGKARLKMLDVFIVTGGTSGIGLGISAHLLQHSAAKIILVSQKEEHAAEAQEALEKFGDINKLEWIQCDFKDLKWTVQVAEKLKEEKQIDAKTPHSRLIHQSSDLHRAPLSSVTFTSISEINTDIGPMNLYSRTKLAQILFIRALARRITSNAPGFQASLKAEGPWVIATHPGGVSTDQQDQAVDAYGTKGKIGVKAVRPFLKDPIDEGCRSALFAATSEDVAKERLQGVYIVPDRKVTEPSKQAQGEELGENLWKLCREILKEKVEVEVPE
ncbi:uncharacterized protein KY384_004592 [Bacidia gigantensis]|uniref:uncharacterized protein n=1 Tax=Bacidia gigantensis TaxID=2732470 RepID=UPI001D03E4C1|nr:uncharacterized protein KY384_004592 [Bacidia gigantensis]KAG8531234.1 hypothetical protein KY384_004592 [Bacidia gigantensis]